MKNRSCLLCLVLSALSACAAQTADPSTDPFAGGEPTDAPEPRVLAEITGPAGQRVVFLETGPDEVTVQETGEVGTLPMLEREWKGRAELYTELAPVIDPHVLELLERADQRATELDSEAPPPDWEPQPEAPEAHGAGDGVSVVASALKEEGAHPPLTAEQFTALACRGFDVPPYDRSFCATNTSDADSNWPGPTNLTRAFTLHASGTGFVTVNEFKWVCLRKSFGICTGWGWAPFEGLVLGPNEYGLFVSEDPRRRYKAVTSPGNTLFHFAVHWDMR